MTFADPDCLCGHPQSWHERGIGRCTHACGCVRVRLHRAGQGIEILEVLDAGKPGAVAPTVRVRCPHCRREYATRSWPRDLVQRKGCRACADRQRAARKNPGAGASRPATLPALERFADRPHGARVRYLAGCRCEACREANNAYERMRAKLRRAGQGNALVSSARVRRHLVKLSAAGVGRRTVADLAGVPPSTLAAVRAGTRTHVRRQTEARILAVGVDALTDAKLVPARSTWRLLDKMLAEGFTRGALALRLGKKTPALQVRRDRVTARTRARVERLYRQLCGGESGSG
jgi:Zn ribbon nucleic-acid-binding protein